MIPFGQWLPDVATFENSAVVDVSGVIPSLTGYRPFPAFVSATSAITARSQGAITSRSTAGVISNFCGDATKLYKLDSAGTAWSDVSRTVGGAYATPNDGWWDFVQFGNYVIATNGVDTPQVFQLGVSSNFAALSGSPPIASFVGAIRGFGVFCRVSTAWNRVHWSGIEDITTWVASATTLSDAQDLQDGGACMGFVGGEFGIVFQERAVQRMAFEGPPTAFRFDKISNFLGCRLERSIASYENLAFFASDDGFFMIRAGTELIPIGDEKVDRWFEENFDPTYPYRVSSAIDPVRRLYMLGFPSTAAVSGSPDTIIAYHWPSGKWTKSSISHELIYTTATQSGYTLDGLDSVSGSIDALPASLDSRLWSGSGRLLLSAFDTSHQQGYFVGSNLAATLETGDAQLVPGRKAMLRGLRPMIEGTSVTPSVLIRSRDRLQDALMDSTAVAANASGMCPVRVNARYHRARVTIPAASSWTFATGVDDLKFTAMAQR